MAFPASPSFNQEYTHNGVIYIFNGRGWVVKDVNVSSGHVIKDSAVSFSPRSGLKFTGNVTVTDDETNNNTIIDIPEPIAGSAHTIKDSTSSLPQKPNLKFDGFNVDTIGDDTVIKSSTDATYSGSITLNKRKETYYNPFFQTSDTTIPTPSGTLGNGQVLVLPFVGNGVNTLSFSSDWKEIKNEFVSNTAKYWIITGVRIAGQWFYKVEATNATAVANPDFVTGTWASNNTYLDIQLNTPAYGDNLASTPLDLSDFLVTFYQNGGGATSWTPTTLTKTTGLPLTGGETVYRMGGTLAGSATGVEYVTVKASGATSIYNSIGVAMTTSATTAHLILSNQADIVTQLKAIVAWDTLLIAENYDTTTRVWTDAGDLLLNAVADGAAPTPSTKTSNWSNGKEAVNFDSKSLLLGNTYPLFSALRSNFVIGEITTEVGAVVYNASYLGLEWGGGKFDYQGIYSGIAVDRSYIGKKFISVLGQGAISYPNSSNLVFQNGDSNKQISAGTYAVNKANLGSRPGGSSLMNGKIAFFGKTSVQVNPTQYIQIINTLDNYYNILEDSKYIVFEGDSLTYGIGATLSTAYPTQLIQNLESTHGETIRFSDVSTSGTRWRYVEGPTYYTSDLNTTPILSINKISNSNKLVCIWLGTNDLVEGTSASTLISNLTTYINKRIANGCTKFVVFDIIVRSGMPEVQRLAYNSALSTLAVQGATIKHCALANDSRLNDYTNLTYFGSDQIHLTQAGYGAVAELAKPKIEEIFWPA